MKPVVRSLLETDLYKFTMWQAFLHMHPNAESMFVFLSGKVRFTVNGEDHIVGKGQACYFPMGDRHGLRVAEGDGVSFLEFHCPAAYTTVKD